MLAFKVFQILEYFRIQNFGLEMVILYLAMVCAFQRMILKCHMFFSFMILISLKGELLFDSCSHQVFSAP